MLRFVVAATALALLLPTARIAEAGCICPDVTNVRVGDLDVTGATVKAQRWTVSNARLELELELAQASAATTIDVLAMGVPENESQELVELLRANNRNADAYPQATATVGGTALTGAVTRRDGAVRVAWKLGAGAKPDTTVKLAWSFPPAGADADPVAKPLVEEFCIDSGTRKALKRADGYLRVDLVLSEDMAANLTLRVSRERLPISLCARKVKKLDKHVFEIRGRENLQDKHGVLPILFGETI